MTDPVPLLRALADCVGAAHVLTAPGAVAPYLTDWRRRYTGRALAVVRPATAGEVAAVVRACVAAATPVVPQGGNTGLVGGATPDGSGRAVLLQLGRLNRIRALDPVNGTLVAEAGCVLQTVQDAARARDRLFPLSLAAEGSATLGGNLASNAGGTQVLRYGNARELCLGLEVVTAQGELWDGLRGLRKDNTGYDLRDLYIGAEGTLGVITAACMKLYPLPRGGATALVAVSSIDAAVRLLQRAQDVAGPALTGCELMNALSLQLVARHFAPLASPLTDTPFQVLLELSDHESDTHARETLERLLEAAFGAGDVSDAVVAQSQSQAQRFWQVREAISEAQAAEGRNIKHDIALPIGALAEFVRTTDAALLAAHAGVRLVNFGHLGDGNLHYNVSPPPGESEADFQARLPAINRLVHDRVAACGGSISAEHGIGQLKRVDNARYKSAVELRLMRAIKQALDPLDLMNPGKLLPPDLADTR